MSFIDCTVRTRLNINFEYVNLTLLKKNLEKKTPNFYE